MYYKYVCLRLSSRLERGLFNENYMVRICAFIVLYNFPFCPTYLLCQDILNVIQLKEALLEDTVHTYVLVFQCVQSSG